MLCARTADPYTRVQIWRYDADIGVKQFLSAQRVVFLAPAWQYTTLAHVRTQILYNYSLAKPRLHTYYTMCVGLKMAERPFDSVARAGSSQQMLVASFFPSLSSSETDSSIGGSSRQPSTVDDSVEERGDGVPPDTHEERAVLPPSKRRRDRPDKRTFHEE